MSDPDSKVSFSECNENGVKDFSIVSDQVRKKYRNPGINYTIFKGGFQFDSYRIGEDGVIRVPEVQAFTDHVAKNNDINARGDDKG